MKDAWWESFDIIEFYFVTQRVTEKAQRITENF